MTIPNPLPLTVQGVTVKSLRESLCSAQAALLAVPRRLGTADRGRTQIAVNGLQRLINACDELRPLGPDGVHGTGERCTQHCGCERSEHASTCTHPADAMCPQCCPWPKCSECNWYHDPELGGCR